MSTGFRHVLAKVFKQHLASTGGDFAQSEHGIELVPLDAFVPLIALGVGHDLVEHQHILQPVGHPGIGRQAVTAGTPGFLIVGLDTLGQVQVRDKAHVGFVDTHAKGDGGNHDQAVFIEKALLVEGAQLVRQAGMIG